MKLHLLSKTGLSPESGSHFAILMVLPRGTQGDWERARSSQVRFLMLRDRRARDAYVASKKRTVSCELAQGPASRRKINLRRGRPNDSRGAKNIRIRAHMFIQSGPCGGPCGLRFGPWTAAGRQRSQKTISEYIS